MMKFYILNENHEPIEAELNQWSNWFSHFENRRINETTLYKGTDDEVWISTVFLGLPSFRYGGDADKPKDLFETMVFCSKCNMSDYQVRWDTWDQAVAGHKDIVRKVLMEHKLDPNDFKIKKEEL